MAKDVTLLVKDKNHLGELLQQLSDTFHGLADTLEAESLPSEQSAGKEHRFTLKDIADLDVSCILFGCGPLLSCGAEKNLWCGLNLWQTSMPLVAGDVIMQGGLRLYEVGTQPVDIGVYMFLLPSALVVREQLVHLYAECKLYRSQELNLASTTFSSLADCTARNIRHENRQQ